MDNDKINGNYKLLLNKTYHLTEVLKYYQVKQTINKRKKIFQQLNDIFK